MGGVRPSWEVLVDFYSHMFCHWLIDQYRPKMETDKLFICPCFFSFWALFKCGGGRLLFFIFLTKKILKYIPTSSDSFPISLPCFFFCVCVHTSIRYFFDACGPYGIYIISSFLCFSLHLHSFMTDPTPVFRSLYNLIRQRFKRNCLLLFENWVSFTQRHRHKSIDPVLFSFDQIVLFGAINPTF